MKNLFITIVFLLAFSAFAQDIKPTIKDSVKVKTSSLDEVKVYGNKKQFLKVEADKTIVSVKDNPM